MQKYLIFFSDRVIRVASNEPWTPRMGRVVLQGSGVHDLHRWLKKLEQDTGIREITWQVDDPAAAFHEFVHSLKMIQAAGGVVSLGGKALFIFRFGRWDLPKGKMELGESPEQTALREVEEECGVGGLKLERSFSDTFHIYPYEGQYVVKQTFWFGMSTCHSGLLKPQIEEGIEKVAWIEPSLWDSIVIPQTYPSLWPLLVEAKQWMLPEAELEDQKGEHTPLTALPSR
jgi:8-oxo-dGTP pyrophosphatase MutT (NUDIX family)